MISFIKKFWTHSIQRQLILGIALVHAILMTVFVADLVSRQKSFLSRQSVEQTEALAGSLAANSVSWVLADDVVGLEEIVRSQKNYPNIEYAMILSPRGKVLAHTDRSLVGQYVQDPVSLTLMDQAPDIRHLINDRNLLDIGVPIFNTHKHIGWARVAISQKVLHTGLEKILRDGIGYTFLAIIAGSIFAIFVARGITTGIRQLLRLTRQVEDGDIDTRVEDNRPDELGQLGQAFNKMIDRIRQSISELVIAQQLALEEKEKYQSMFDNAVEGFFQSTPKGRFISFNPAFAKMLGYASPEELVSSITDIAAQYYVNDEDRNRFKQVLQKTGSVNGFEFKARCKDGSHIWVSNSTRVIHDQDDRIVRYEGNVTDITQRRQAEEENTRLETRYRQTQKMESIGTLAGGIAHDFNNILFPIMGHTEMLLEDVPLDSPLRNSLNGIYTGALRARDLVKQILTFSRQESSELMLMKMQPIIKEALKLIRSTIPSSIEIIQDISADCGAVKADSTQIHQVVMNLATNAYHAMEETGGELTVSFSEIELCWQDVLSPEMGPGTYACLTIADTGLGMEKALTEKIFDPFFTTKKQGKGTGMGLSVVHGIVKSMGGGIQVYSEPGKGTKFHVYLPVEKRFSEKQAIPSQAQIQGGTEKILLVDDEQDILTMEKQMLERLGYQVSSRTSSIEALEAFRKDPDKFDLVITDMAMPNMSGDRLAAELIGIRLDIPILMCTGFSETLSEETAASLGIRGFLLKPIVMKDLDQKVREVLGENKNDSAE